MKFNISINQKAIIDNKFNIDIIDAAIFELFKDFSHSKACNKMLIDGHTYYIFSWKLVRDQLPLLNLNTKAPIHKRYNKLISAGLLDRYNGNESMMQPLYKFGDNYNKMIFTPVSENNLTISNEIHSRIQLDTVPVSNEIPNNIYKDNSIKNNNKNTSKDVSEFFDWFWNTYNKKHDKVNCIKKVKRLTVAEQEAIKSTLPKYIAACQDKQYLKHPLSYLNGECWNDEIQERDFNGTVKAKAPAMHRKESDSGTFGGLDIQSITNSIKAS